MFKVGLYKRKGRFQNSNQDSGRFYVLRMEENDGIRVLGH